MKNLLLITAVILFSVLIGCKKEEEQIPTCADGIMNGTETGIDCGGSCQPCFECLSEYCSYLSGATSEEPKTSITWENQFGETFTCFSSSQFEEPYSDNDGNPGVAKGNWSFDDPSNPTKILVVYDEYPYWWESQWTLDLVSLDQDELIVKKNETSNISYTPVGN